MAALLAPTPVAPPAPRDRSWVALTAAVAALVSGVIVLVAGVVLPDSPSHPMAVPNTVVNPALAARFDAAQDAAGATGAPPFLHLGPVPTHGHRGTDQSPPVLPEVDGQWRARPATGCLGPEVTRATQAEPTDLATIPPCVDPRHALAMMAAQNRGRVSDACPCLLGVPSYRSSLSNSDDRIANALFGASSSLDVVPWEPWDRRQDLTHVEPSLMSGRIAAAQNALFPTAPTPTSQSFGGAT